MNQPLQPRAPAENKASEIAQKQPTLNTAELATAVEKNVVAVGTAGNAKEMLAGMEGKIEEKDHSVSEHKNDTAVSPGVSSQAASGHSGAAMNFQGQATVPTKTEIVSTVQVALQVEVRSLEAQVKKLKKEALKFAHELSEAFQKLRTLKSLLRDLLTFTVDFLKMLYEKVMKRESLATVQY